jgi:hypothetical protein
MPKTETATPSRTVKPRTRPAARSNSKKTAVKPTDATALREEIAKLAYCKWLDRSGGPANPEEDWLRAELEVRASLSALGALAES